MISLIDLYTSVFHDDTDRDTNGMTKREEQRHELKKDNNSTIDGIKIDFAENWVHLRKSNTEPIIRIYTEAQTQQLADDLAIRIIDEIKAVSGL